MDRKSFIEEMDIHLKLVRTEYGCTQEMMARILGISKKTLVEIEKGRSSLGWPSRERSPSSTPPWAARSGGVSSNRKKNGSSSRTSSPSITGHWTGTTGGSAARLIWKR